MKCFSCTAWYDFAALFIFPFFIASVIADFEKNDFFDSCVTKERFFLTLHDAVLAALDKHQKPDEVELTAKESAEEPPAEQQKVEYLA